MLPQPAQIVAYCGIFANKGLSMVLVCKSVVASTAGHDTALAATMPALKNRKAKLPLRSNNMDGMMTARCKACTSSDIHELILAYCRQ